MHIFDHNNRQFCQHYTISWAKKVNTMLFLSDFSRKNHCSHAYILSKKPPFSKKHNVLIPIFNQKIVHSLKNTVLSCHFFNIFFKKPTAVMPIFGKKTSILSKLHYIFSKSQCSLVIPGRVLSFLPFNLPNRSKYIWGRGGG